MMVQLDKEKIRRSILTRLRQQAEDLRRRKSGKVLERLAGLDGFREKQWLFCYVSLDYEADTTRLIDNGLASGKRVVVPVIFKEGKKSGKFLISEIRDRLKELEIGPFGICQPKHQFIRPVRPDVLEIAVIPGIAFGREGHRLGHGKGFFDRFLERLPPTCLKVGIGFDFQLVPKIPSESHDVPLDVIVTDQEIIHISLSS